MIEATIKLMKPIQKEAFLWEKPKSTSMWCIW